MTGPAVGVDGCTSNELDLVLFPCYYYMVINRQYIMKERFILKGLPRVSLIGAMTMLS